MAPPMPRSPRQRSTTPSAPPSLGRSAASPLAAYSPRCDACSAVCLRSAACAAPLSACIPPLPAFPQTPAFLHRLHSSIACIPPSRALLRRLHCSAACIPPPPLALGSLKAPRWQYLAVHSHPCHSLAIPCSPLTPMPLAGNTLQSTHTYATSARRRVVAFAPTAHAALVGGLPSFSDRPMLVSAALG